MVTTLYWIVFALLLVGAVLYKWLCDRLQSHHPQVWKALGEPSLFMGASIRAQYRASKFLRDRTYEDLGDERLARIAVAYRVLTLVIVILIFLAVAGFTCLRA